ncbi:MAG: PKD domain-containing protein [Planctomycetes bacterium]|nr:PKD domain-containing protein [Planctomycetota bacterium]
MNRTFLLAIMAIVFLVFSGPAIADQVIVGGTVENPVEYISGDTDDYVIVGTGSLVVIPIPSDPNDGNEWGHAFNGGAYGPSIVNKELGIGIPGFKGKTGFGGYEPLFSPQASLILLEDPVYLTVPSVTVSSEINVGGGTNGVASLTIEDGTLNTVSVEMKVGVGNGAHGSVNITGGALNLDGSSSLILSDSEDPNAIHEDNEEPPIGQGTLTISAGELTGAVGSSITIGNLDDGLMVIDGQGITSISVDDVTVTDLGQINFIIDNNGTSPSVEPIDSTGNVYFEDGSVIDLIIDSAVTENILKGYGDSASERTIDLVSASDLKWNETGYNVSISVADDYAWDLQEVSNTLQAVYIGGTGSDLIVNTGTVGSPTAIGTGLWQNILIGYGTQVPESPIVVDGHASINAAVTCTEDLFIARGDDCNASLTIGTGGDLGVAAGSVYLASGDSTDASLNLEGTGNMFVQHHLRLGYSLGSETLVAGNAELNISGDATLNAEYLLVGDYEEPGPAATVNQTGGTVEIRENLYIGRNSEAGAQGSSYTISGGSMDVGNQLYVGFDNDSASIASTLHVDGLDTVCTAESLSVATYCTLKFTVEDGDDFTGDVTPVDMRGHGHASFAFFYAKYIGDAVDPNNCSIIDLEFAPGTMSLIAAQELDLSKPLEPSPAITRGIDLVLFDHGVNSKWRVNDTAYEEGTTNIIDHVYGLKMADANWVLSEIDEGNNSEIEGPVTTPYCHLRAYYMGPQTPFPVPTADAGPDQLDIVGEIPVTLDGSGSTATEGRSIVTWVWSWTIGSDEYEIIDSDATAEAYFPVGTHTVTLTVISDIGESDSDTCTIAVPSARIPGDIDASDKVDFADFNILKTYYNQQDPDL